MTNHVATLEPSTSRWVVARNGVEIANSTDAVLLVETYGDRTMDPVPYFPPDAVAGAELRPSTHHTFCPIKGTADYFSVLIDGEELENSVWYYPEPQADLEAIAGYVAFYPDRFDIIEAD